MSYFNVYCISNSDDCMVVISHLKAESAEQAMELAELYFPVDAQSAKEWSDDAPIPD